MSMSLITATQNIEKFDPMSQSCDSNIFSGKLDSKLPSKKWSNIINAKKGGVYIVFFSK